jgi:hypothetical protein
MLSTLFFFGVAFQAGDPAVPVLDAARVHWYGLSFAATSIRTGQANPAFPTVAVGRGTLRSSPARDDEAGTWTPRREDRWRWLVTPDATGTIEMSVHYGPMTFTTTDAWGGAVSVSYPAQEAVIRIENFKASDVDKNGFVNGDDFDTFSAWFKAGDPRADWDDNGFVNGDDFDFFTDFFVRGA